MEEILKFLHKIPIFKPLNEDELKYFATLLEEEHFEENSVIFKEGDPGDRMYIIESGIVDIKKLIPSRETGETLTLTRLHAGNIFGEFTLFDHKSRSATSIAFFESKLYSLNTKSIDKLVKEQPVLATKFFLQVITDLVSKLRSTDDTIKDLSKRLLGM
ncbi:MAG: cyclic nucleotide-binding domain-containing protein [Elusimicrobiota bacterium]